MSDKSKKSENGGEKLFIEDVQYVAPHSDPKYQLGGGIVVNLKITNLFNNAFKEVFYDVHGLGIFKFVRGDRKIKNIPSSHQQNRTKIIPYNHLVVGEYKFTEELVSRIREEFEIEVYQKAKVGVRENEKRIPLCSTKVKLHVGAFAEACIAQLTGAFKKGSAYSNLYVLGFKGSGSEELISSFFCIMKLVPDEVTVNIVDRFDKTFDKKVLPHVKVNIFHSFDVTMKNENYFPTYHILNGKFKIGGILPEEDKNVYKVFDNFENYTSKEKTPQCCILVVSVSFLKENGGEKVFNNKVYNIMENNKKLVIVITEVELLDEDFKTKDLVDLNKKSRLIEKSGVAYEKFSSKKKNFALYFTSTKEKYFSDFYLQYNNFLILRKAVDFCQTGKLANLKILGKK